MCSASVGVFAAEVNALADFASVIFVCSGLLGSPGQIESDSPRRRRTAPARHRWPRPRFGRRSAVIGADPAGDPDLEGGVRVDAQQADSRNTRA